MELITLPLGKIHPYQNNPRKNESAVEAVAESIRQCGYVAPIVVDENGEVLCGHTRLKALRRLGRKEAECVVKKGLSEEQKRKYRILDNRTNELSDWNIDLLDAELDGLDFDGFDFGFDDLLLPDEEEEYEAGAAHMQHNVFENQERMQLPGVGYYGIPAMRPTRTVGTNWIRFADWKEADDPANTIAHFYYDDYKFISAWREPDKYIDRLRRFKAVVSPDFSVYTDFPRAVQILACYRRQWCGAYWQMRGIDVIPDVVWGDRESWSYCFDGIPMHGTVAVSTVGVRRDAEWNGKEDNLFRAGYEEMMRRLEPTTVLLYGDMMDGLAGNIVRIPPFYEQRRAYLRERKRAP